MLFLLPSYVVILSVCSTGMLGHVLPNSCCSLLCSHISCILVGNCISSCVRWLHCSVWTPLKCLNGVRFSINVLFLSIIFSCFINWIYFICGLGRFLDSYREAVNVFDSSAWQQTCSWVVLKKCCQQDLILGICHVFIHKYTIVYLSAFLGQLCVCCYKNSCQ